MLLYNIKYICYVQLTYILNIYNSYKTLNYRIAQTRCCKVLIN